MPVIYFPRSLFQLLLTMALFTAVISQETVELPSSGATAIHLRRKRIHLKHHENNMAQVDVEQGGHKGIQQMSMVQHMSM
mmetsp:Transcript_13747/g.20146  ORF Transcript_13747/g.20146 Transcript_13747/m.20146 type:complete len:80 (-) Transcript_13747:291-530(-)|eukprot:CAMPEP_0194048984 /NCGR_PEP_ID=MMETSP0009_2-20130614/29255_1 /TAXON_ID=210454 /ORGANISM="Grammatophora oceanica, Strain CCMP 410" /LENGTH=79 /DNA_ID=CAMNT_0038695029 /DNA_START=131 /DNA_END=370 /DNA_ORIENTATION=+